MPLLTFPLALLALSSIPALAAIYWLRNRFQRHTVSSLMLWGDQREAREGGTRVRRLQTPPLFYVEAAALALLALGATAPQVRGLLDPRPLVVVLDDSYSMLAGAPDSPRARGTAAVERELRADGGRSVRVIVAGRTARTLGDTARTPGEAVALLREWKCQSPAADLPRAIALAGELAGAGVRVLVVTDAPPPEGLEAGRLRWWSFGRALPNFAFVSAARTTYEDRHRCLLEIANLSPEAGRVALTIEKHTVGGDSGGGGAAVAAPVTEHSVVAIGAHATARVIFEVPATTGELRARLADDALAIDNEVVLLPPADKIVRVRVDAGDATVRRAVEKVVEATGRASLGGLRPNVIVTDHDSTAANPESEAWHVLVRVPAANEAAAYVGPFVVDHAHPLTKGLTLEGVVWSAAKPSENGGAGVPVIAAGNTPLLTDTLLPGGAHRVGLSLRPELSTLQESPAWPILWWNLMEWRAAWMPGLDHANTRLGGEVHLTLEKSVREVRVTGPDGVARTVPAGEVRVTLPGDLPGIYTVRAGEGRYQFAVAALDQDESDLSHAAGGQWGQWEVAGAKRPGYRDAAWVVLLAALLALTAHAALLARAQPPPAAGGDDKGEGRQS